MKPEKYDNILPYTQHTSNSIRAKSHLFTNCVLDKVEKLLVDEEIATKRNNIFRTVNANNNIIEAKEDKIIAEGNQLFGITYDFLKRVDKSLVKVYFKDSKPHLAKKLDKILKALKRGLVIILNDEYDHLNNYKDKYIKMIAKLEEYIPIVTDMSNEFNTAKDEFAEAIMNWTVTYGKLKNFVKGELLNTGIDYREFFLDLLKKKNSSSSDSDNKDKEESKENNSEDSSKKDNPADSSEESNDNNKE